MSDLKTELLKIRQQHGELYPRLAYQSVAADRDAWPALNSLIGDDWDDSAAAVKYRIEKIRHAMKRELGVTYSTEDAPRSLDEYRGRSFYAIPQEGKVPIWEPVEEVMGNPAMRKVAVAEMERRINELVVRYQAFEEFVPTMIKALRSIRRKQAKGDAAAG